MPEDFVGPAERTRWIQNVAGDRKYFQRPLCVERWLRNKAPLTQQRYPRYLNRLQILTGLTPEQFLAWCKSVESVEVQDLIDRTSLDFKPAIQFCYKVAIRSFLHHNGYSSLPKADLQYVSQAWHRGYKREEIQRLLGQLRQKHHRLFVMMAAESGLRSHVLMELRYRHIMEDLESGTVPIAVRLEPRFYAGRKAAGYTFLGQASARLLRDALKESLVEEEPDARLVPRSYYSVRVGIYQAKRVIGLDSKIQPCHGLRKYFENSLDHANIDHERKMMLEGHFAGTRARHYTDREVEELRQLYINAYSFITIASEDCIDVKAIPQDLGKKLVEIESKLARQKILQARVEVLEAELEQLKQSQRGRLSD